MGFLTLGVIGVVVVVLVTTLAPRTGIAAPLVLTLLGIGVSFLPIIGPIELNPEWVLVWVLPPLLYSTAVNTPTMDFRRDLSTISIFAVLLVIVSAVGIGFLLAWLVPGLPLPVGIAVGAIVSPTDAVATGIVRKAGVSPRIVTVLEGEALFNDASSLVLLRSAVAAFSVTVSFWSVAVDFLYAVALALLIGFVVGHLNVAIRSRIPQVASNVAFSLVTPFLAFVPAEHLHASGLVAAVTAGLVTGHHTPERLAAEVRIAEQAVWRTAELLLESAVFLLMGVQLAALLNDVHHSPHTEWMAVFLGAAAATAVIAARSLFVAAAVWLLARRARRMPSRRKQMVALQSRLDSAEPANWGGRPVDPRRINRVQQFLERQVADLDYLAAEQFGWKDGVILVTAGMRGAITLAAAQSLPLETPYRSLLVLTAFVVAAGTLMLQGFTLAPLVKLLKITGRDPHADDELMCRLRGELAAAALADLEQGVLRRPDGTQFPAEVIAESRKLLETVIDPDEELSEQAVDLAYLRLEVIESQRAELLRIRNQGTYPSELLDSKLAQLDADQIGIELRHRPSD
ncbi:MAG: sodium:proton antiporter [Propionibacteriaceae bacterium]|jgi:CPA1 family monovalent cation:H+ antiporter|nr:sodium:proton antiporter [Propionibacteriaceae bacterium]